MEHKLDGKKIAAAINEEVRQGVRELLGQGMSPRLDVLLVGDDPASEVYVGSKSRMCEKLQISSTTHRLPAETRPEEVAALIRRLNSDEEVDGILIQLPLPAHLPSRELIELIDPLKDVDGFHPENIGRLQQGRPRLVPCTPAGIMEMLKREDISIEGRRAVIVGRSDIVGKPMAMLLMHANATVTICHSRTKDLASMTRQAEILVAAAGSMALIGEEYVREGAVVIDVGMHRVEDPQRFEELFGNSDKKRRAFEKRGSVLTGDVDYQAVAPKAGRITPVPGGVGPLTIAMLMHNTLRAARLRREGLHVG